MDSKQIKANIVLMRKSSTKELEPYTPYLTRVQHRIIIKQPTNHLQVSRRPQDTISKSLIFSVGRATI